MPLIFAANDIGNQKDIPLRSLEALRTADLVIFEEDRVARQTLKAAGLHRSYIKFNEHNRDLPEEITEALQLNHSVVYMSDQGMPNVADPGQKLLKYAFANGMRVEVIPGPSSISSALAAFPEDASSYHYAGFLARDEKSRKRELADLKSKRVPMVILDAPYRLQALLKDCVAVFGASRKALLAVDISGAEEDFLFETLKDLEKFSDGKKLNFVLILTSD